MSFTCKSKESALYELITFTSVIQPCRLQHAVKGPRYTVTRRENPPRFMETLRERAEVHGSVIISTGHSSVIPPISAWISLSRRDYGETDGILPCNSHKCDARIIGKWNGPKVHGFRLHSLLRFTFYTAVPNEIAVVTYRCIVLTYS